jgi:hypothetical protein
MPSFLNDNLGFDIQSAGILSVFPYLALFISTLGFGWAFEYCQLHRGWSVNNVRQVAQFVSYLGSTVCLVLSSFMEDKYVAYFFMILTQVRSSFFLFIYLFVYLLVVVNLV